MGRRKEEGSASLVEELDEVSVAGDVTPKRANRFRQGADLDVDSTVQTEMIDRAASVASKHPARMRVVDHHDAAELVGCVAQLGKRAEVAVHAEDAIGDQQFTCGRWQILENGASRRHIAVRKDLDCGAAEPRSIDDARV